MTYYLYGSLSGGAASKAKISTSCYALSHVDNKKNIVAGDEGLEDSHVSREMVQRERGQKDRRWSKQ